MPDADCLSEDEIVLLAEGQQTARHRFAVSHVESCDVCRFLLGEARSEVLANTSTDPTPAAERNTGPAARYTNLQEVGSGGVGVVYRAFDSTLGREVALKVLHSSTRASAALLDESRAMAKVRHANVVTVFDVVADDGPPFIVSEFITGGTFRMWLQHHPVKERAWRPLLRTFGGVAAGLHAAHEVGLVHRDLKPSNILLDEDGTPKVCDFGLASVDQQSAPTTVTESDMDAKSQPLTRRLQGTPAYMSPEQATGSSVDRRSDVFSFCVALWESLEGRRPYAEETLASRFAAARRGTLLAPQRRDVPQEVYALLRRGLSPTPDERPSDLELVRIELERLADTRTTRLGRAGIAAAAAAVGLATVTAVALRDPEPAATPSQARAVEACIETLPQTQVSDAQWQPVHAKLEERDGPRGQLNSAQMRDGINARLNAQHLSARAACDLAEAQDEPNKRKHLAWKECLLFSRYQLEEAVAAAATSLDALEATQRLRTPEDCEALSDEMVAANIEVTTDPEILRQLSRIHVSTTAGHPDPAAAARALERAREAGAPMLEMRALMVLLRASQDQPAELESAADRAATFAVAAGSEFYAAEAELDRWLLSIDGTKGARSLDAAKSHVDGVHTEAARVRLDGKLTFAQSLKQVMDGDPQGALQTLRVARGLAQQHAPWRLPTMLLYAARMHGQLLGDYQEMATTLEELALWHESSGMSSSSEIATAHLDLANTWLQLEDTAAAQRAWNKASALADQGTLAHDVALRLALAELRIASQQESYEAVLTGAAELRARKLFDEQDPVGEELQVLEAAGLIALGRLDEAQPKLQPAQRAFEEKQPLRSRRYPVETLLLAQIALLRGQPSLAHALLEEVAAESHAIFPASYEAAYTALLLGEILEALGEPEDAKIQYDRALAGLPGRGERASAQARLALLSLRTRSRKGALTADERAVLAELVSARDILAERPLHHATLLQAISRSGLIASDAED